MINIMLVDDHALVRTAIRRILEDARDISVIAEADSGEQALSETRIVEPDIVLMDVSMPGIGGLEATRKITRSYPRIKVIAVTIHDCAPFPERLLEAGAAGYLTKGCNAAEMIEAIKAVHMGKHYVSTDIAQKLAFNRLSGDMDTPFDSLTPREMQVMLMTTQGLTISEIGAQLFLSSKTVCTFRYRIFDKLDVNNDVELTHLAIRYGIIATMALH